MTDEQKWTVVWTGWTAFFAVAEARAVRSRRPEAPLSYQLRRVLGTRGGRLHRAAGRAAMGFGVMWLASHLYEQALDTINGNKVL